MIRQSTILAVTPMAMEIKGDEVENIISTANAYEVVSNVLTKVGYEYQAPLSAGDEQEVICRHIKNVVTGEAPKQPGDIIIGLNDTTSHIAGFTPENIATDLPEYTEVSKTHGEVLDVVTTKIADSIRANMSAISKLVKPICVEIDNTIRQTGTGGEPIDLALNYLNLKMVNLEPEFLSSTYCPSSMPVRMQETSRVNLKELLKGDFPAFDDDTIYDLVYIDNSVIATFFESRDEVKSVYNKLFVNKAWWDFISAQDREGDIVDFMSVSHYSRFDRFREIVIANLIINRLVSMDVPLEGVVGVSLADYRGSLALTRDVFATMLYRFRQLWAVKAAAGVVVMDEQVRYDTADYGVLEGVKVLMGTVQVGYNRTVLEQFAANDEISLSEVIVGYLYASKQGAVIRDIITDMPVCNAGAKSYMGDLIMTVSTRSVEMGTSAIVQALRNLYGKEEYEAIIEAMNSDVPQNGRVLDAVQKQLDLSNFFSPWTVQEIQENKRSMMNTALPVVLCNIFGAPIAAEILKVNQGVSGGTQEQHRKRLTGAIVDTLLSRLYVA